MGIMELKKDLDYFTAMNDDCIFEVFERLTLCYLIRICLTCDKLKQLAGHHFRRKFPEMLANPISISLRRLDSRIESSIKCRQGCYGECFSQQMRNVMIIYDGVLDEQSLPHIRRNISRNLIKINFSCWGWSKSFADGIKDFLQCIESVSFDIKKTEPGSFVDILQYMPHVRSLGIHYYTAGVGVPAMILPKLEAIEITGYPVMNQLKNFFQENLTLKRFTWRAGKRYNLDLTKELLRLIADSSIEEFFFDRLDTEVDFALFENEFRTLDKRESFKRFEIELYGQNIKNISILSSLKSFTGFHISFGMLLGAPYYSAFNLFVNLTTLSINLRLQPVCPTLSENLSQHLNFLKEFYLFQTHGGFCPLLLSGDLSDVIMPFNRNSAKLEKIFVIINDKYPRFNVEWLNTERKELKDATKLTIYLVRERSWIYSNRRKLNLSIQDSEYVTIHPTDIIEVRNKIQYSNPLLRLSNWCGFTP